MCSLWIVQYGLAGRTECSRLEGVDGEASAVDVEHSGCRSWHNQDPWWSETKVYKN